MPLSEKEKSQKFQEKYQAVLSNLLKDDENKYCADCDAKGPRWASWNIGVFVCIRCAGIHRNLGVHISRVKSVNLDQWTAEQIASMQSMGNSKGRSIYEANLPETFRRSQTDSAMEQFIRNKYEQKKWIDKEWRQESVVVPTELKEDDSGRDKRKSKNDNKINLDSAFNSMKIDSSKTKKSSKAAANLPQTQKVETKNESTLLDFGSNDVFQSNNSTNQQQSENQLDLFNLGSAVAPAPNENNNAPLFEVDFDNNFSTGVDSTDNQAKVVEKPATTNTISNDSDFNSLLISSSSTQPSIGSATTGGNKCLDKNSILALYSQGTTNNFMPASNTNNNMFASSAANNQTMQGNFNTNAPFNQMNMGTNQMGLNSSINMPQNGQQSQQLNNFMNQSPQISQMNMLGQNNFINQNNNNTNSQDIFDAFSNKNLFSANFSSNNNNTNGNMPNIGNTLSSDLWQ